MREIDSSAITDVVKKLFMSANYYLSSDIKSKLIECSGIEISKVGKEILSQIIQNSEIAAAQKIPICQDTGMSIVFIEIGQDVHVIGDNITDAINSGVRKAYDEGYLRKSVVRDPINRTNTGDNTPAVIYYDIVPGDNIKVSVMPKGFGSENMSAVKMLTPSAGLEGVVEFVLDVVKKAGDNVLINGIIYCARDAAHKKIYEGLIKGENPPFDIKSQIIYYAGPCPAKPGHIIGSAGPTTSGRMDKYTPALIAEGLKGMIGKGMRSKEVIDAMKQYKSVYLAATGGAGALIAGTIKREEVIAYDELGAEAVRKLWVENFPAIVVIDCEGNNLYESEPQKYSNMYGTPITISTK